MMGLEDRLISDERYTAHTPVCAPPRTRDALRPTYYWDEQIRRADNEIALRAKSLHVATPSEDDVHRLARMASLHMNRLRLKYSRGDLVGTLRPDFDAALDWWERTEALREAAWSPGAIEITRTWAVNIDRYVECFWFVGLALTFRIDDIQWARLLVLVGNEGEDGLLDTLIASRQHNRAIGRSFCYPQPYGRLWEASQAPRGFRAQLLGGFVAEWYEGLGNAVRSARQGQETFLKKPSWVGRHIPGSGIYCGYWCIEAAAAALTLRMDDRLCLGHPHYPGDLVRPVLVTQPDAVRLPLSLVCHLWPNAA